jgi:hypothetical protein
MAQKNSGFLARLRSAFGSSPDPSTKDEDVITIVSGLPRSGTSMMMKMLEAGGIPPLTDEIREADADNPKGYYEFERVKQLDKGDTDWLKQARGKAVKVIGALLVHLPPDYEYKVIFMRRQIDEILRSQKQMLVRRGEPTEKVDDVEMSELFSKHVNHITSWIAKQPNMQVIYVSYNDVLQHPVDHANRINQFLGGALDVGEMVNVIDPDLYRQRRQS